MQFYSRHHQIPNWVYTLFKNLLNSQALLWGFDLTLLSLSFKWRFGLMLNHIFRKQFGLSVLFFVPRRHPSFRSSSPVVSPVFRAMWLSVMSLSADPSWQTCTTSARQTVLESGEWRKRKIYRIWSRTESPICRYQQAFLLLKQLACAASRPHPHMQTQPHDDD